MQFLMDRLRPPNVTFRALDSSDLVRVEESVFPTFPAWTFSGWLPNWYVTQLRQALLPDRPSRRSERIYIVRKGSRRLVNQDELLDRLRRHGFRPVALEELSFEEQIRLFHDAEAIVATHGAGLTNLLFATNALVVEIFPTVSVFPHFLLLAASLDHQYRYVLGTNTDNTEKQEDFETDALAVEREVVIGLEALR
jgi:capsular polysaccharide biosynthesis protein